MFKSFVIAAGLATLLASGALAKPVTGMASYYKSGYRTANGERYNPHGFTAAHRSLPFGTVLRVTNIKTGQSVVVRVNDRGPFAGRRIIDLSYGAAKAIGMVRSGVARVSFEVMD